MGKKRVKSSGNLEFLFRQVFATSGKYTWPADLKKAYLYELRTIKQLNTRQLPESLHNRPIDEIVDRIKLIDDDFKIFNEYQQRYERYGKKLVDIFRFEKFTSDEIERITTKLKEKRYDFSGHDNWSPVSVRREPNKVIIALAKTANHIARTKLIPSDLNPDTWKEIESKAKEKLNTGDRLLDVNVKIIGPKRTVITVEILLDKRVVEVSRDNFAVDLRGERITGTQNEKEERYKAVTKVADILGLKESKEKFIKSSETDSKKIINKNVFDKFHNMNKDNFMVTHIRERYLRNDEITVEHSEDVTSDLRKQKLNEIIRKTAAFYDKNGHLTGFFEEHPEHNSTNAAIIGFMKKDPKAVRVAYRSFAIIVRDIKPHEKQTGNYSRHMRHKKIDYVQYDFNRDEGSIEITNQSFSTEAHETIIQQILDLSE